MNRSTVLPCSVRCPAVCFISPGFGSSRIASLPDLGFQRARAEITSWDGYEITPLRDLPALAQRAGLGAIRLKDEATRFCLGQLQGDWRCCTAWHACWPPHWRSTAFRWRHCQPNDGYRDVTEGITVHLCHRWQSRPRRRLDRAALPLSVSNLRPREREPGTDGRDRPIRCGGPPVPGTYDDAAREASRQAAANRWLHESPRRVRHRWWRPRRRVVRRLIGPAVSWRSLRKMRPIRTLLSGWWAFVGTSWKLRIVRT